MNIGTFTSEHLQFNPLSTLRFYFYTLRVEQGFPNELNLEVAGILAKIRSRLKYWSAILGFAFDTR